MPKHAVKSRYAKEIKLFGKNLRTIRKVKGYTIEALAEESGIAYDSLANIELGKLNTSIATVFALAKALKIEPKKLMEF